MRFVSQFKLLLLGIWLGAAVFFIGVAQTAFAVLADHEMAGAVVNRALTVLNFGGLAIAIILLLLSLAGAGGVTRFWLWIERFMFMMLGAACAVEQFVIGIWLSSIRAQMTGPIDQVAADDPLRVQFNTVHTYSEWVMLTGMVAVLIAFVIVANRRTGAAKTSKDDIYDFSKEFKV